MGKTLAERLPELPGPNRMIDGYAMFNDTQMREYAARAVREAGALTFQGIPIVENPAMPDDRWVLVPREPAEAMQDAHRMYGDTSDWWQAVVAAAPTQEKES